MPFFPLNGKRCMLCVHLCLNPSCLVGISRRESVSQFGSRAIFGQCCQPLILPPSSYRLSPADRRRYMSGHAHSLQHISRTSTRQGEGSPTGNASGGSRSEGMPYLWHQFVSGGGGSYLLPREPHLKDHFRTHFARPAHGFMSFSVAGNGAWNMSVLEPRPRGEGDDSHASAVHAAVIYTYASKDSD